MQAGPPSARCEGPACVWREGGRRDSLPEETNAALGHVVDERRDPRAVLTAAGASRLTDDERLPRRPWHEAEVRVPHLGRAERVWVVGRGARTIVVHPALPSATSRAIYSVLCRTAARAARARRAIREGITAPAGDSRESRAR